VLSVILTALGSEGACVDVKPSWVDRGPVDFGMGCEDLMFEDRGSREKRGSGRTFIQECVIMAMGLWESDHGCVTSWMDMVMS
jgi:hypothetical protein